MQHNQLPVGARPLDSAGELHLAVDGLDVSADAVVAPRLEGGAERADRLLDGDLAQVDELLGTQRVEATGDGAERLAEQPYLFRRHQPRSLPQPRVPSVQAKRAIS